MSDYEKWCEIIKNTPSHQRVLEKSRETIEQVRARYEPQVPEHQHSAGECEYCESWYREHGIATPFSTLAEYAFAGPAATAESVLSELAMQDLAYVHGAQQALAMAHQSLEAADKWLNDGCGGRRLEALRVLKGTLPSTYTVDHVLEYLDERAQWIDREMRNGGNLEHLRVRYEECRYIASCIRDTKERLSST